MHEKVVFPVAQLVGDVMKQNPLLFSPRRPFLLSQKSFYSISVLTHFTLIIMVSSAGRPLLPTFLPHLPLCLSVCLSLCLRKSRNVSLRQASSTSHKKVLLQSAGLSLDERQGTESKQEETAREKGDTGNGNG